MPRSGLTPWQMWKTCGVADFFEEGEAVVVPYDGSALTEALRRVLGDEELRRRLSEGAQAAARRTSWERIADRQEQLYVSDEGLHRISVFAPDKTFLGKWGEHGHDPGQLAVPGEPPNYSMRVGTLGRRAELVHSRQIWWRSALPWTSDLNLPGAQRLDRQ